MTLEHASARDRAVDRMAGIDGLLNAAGTLELDGPPRVLNRTIKSPDRAGALVVNGTRRSAAQADIPTTLEAGFADAEYPIWFGIFAPAKTPRDIIEKLHRETIKALQAPKVADKLSGLGVDPTVMLPRMTVASAKEKIDEPAGKFLRPTASVVRRSTTGGLARIRSSGSIGKPGMNI